MSDKKVTIEFATQRGFASRPMLFETKTVDKDGAKFFVASSGAYRVSDRDTKTPTKEGVLIGFGSDALKDPDSGQYTDYFAFGADDDKKVIAQQLRELADWFEAQA